MHYNPEPNVETNKALDSLRQTAPEALDLTPRKPNPDGTPVIDVNDVIAYKLEFIVEDVVNLIGSHLEINYPGQSVKVLMKTDYGDAKLNDQVDEELDLYERHFTPWWIWSMTDQYHQRVSPDDEIVKELDDEDFVTVEYDWNTHTIVVENRVMGPTPNVEEFLKNAETQEQRRAARAQKKAEMAQAEKERLETVAKKKSKPS